MDDNSQQKLMQLMQSNPQIAKLLAILQSGGDERLGGALPLGGKANAWSTKGPSSPANGMMLTVPANPRAEKEGYDAYMNIMESMLQDEMQRTTGKPQIPWNVRKIPGY